MEYETRGNWFQRWKARRRVAKIVRECGCCCYCPHCGEPLNDVAKFDYMGRLVVYTCPCTSRTVWDFDHPAPIWLQEVK